MSRLHLALNTDRMEESIAFYRVLFDTEPAKVKPDWAKFDLQEPAVNLTLNRVGEKPGGGDISHLGIELQDSAAVAAVDSRLFPTTTSRLKHIPRYDGECTCA